MRLTISCSLVPCGADWDDLRASESISSYSLRNVGFDITARSVGASTDFMEMISARRKRISSLSFSNKTRSINEIVLSWCMRVGMEAGGCSNALRRHHGLIPADQFSQRKDSLA